WRRTSALYPTRRRTGMFGGAAGNETARRDAPGGAGARSDTRSLVSLVAGTAHPGDASQPLVHLLDVLVLGPLEHELGVLRVLVGQGLPRLLVALGRLVLAQVLAEEGEGLGVLLGVVPLLVLGRRLDLGDVRVGPLVPLGHDLADGGDLLVLLVVGGGPGAVRPGHRHHPEGGEQTHPDELPQHRNTLSLHETAW